MLSEIHTPNEEIFEFDLTELDLPDHVLMIDEEGCYVIYKEFRFFITNAFMADSIGLEEEDNSHPPLLFTPEQKDQIVYVIKNIAGLYTN